MTIRRWAARLLGILILIMAGCGGGQESVLPAPHTAQASTLLGAPQAATVPPATQVTPAQLMDWAEKTYPELFPASGKAEGYSAPYTYRYYPGTRNYIGVSTGQAAVDVYLYGEISSWAILRVGSLADFTCRVSPEACEVRRLSVSQFGSGGILAPDGQAFCAAGTPDCFRDYAPGASVTLTAAAASGWRLRYWSGCDTVAGAGCTVAMASHRTVHPVFERTAAPVFKADVVQLQPTTMSQLISNQGGVLIFSGAASQIASLTAGKVIYSTVGEGLLRRVTSVIALPGGNYIVDTAEAALTDLIAQGTLVLDGRSGVPMAGRGGLPPQAFASVTLSILDANSDGLSGRLEVDLQPEVALDFDTEGVSQFKFIVNPKLKLGDLQFRLKESLIDKRVDINLPITFAPIVVGPVVLTPTANLVGALKANIKVGVELNGQMTASGALGTTYLRSTGWRGVGDFDLSGSFNAPDPLKAKGSGELDASLTFKTGLKIYSLAGPFITTGPFVSARASSTVSTGEACIRWSVRGGVRASAGGEVKFLSYALAAYQVTLAELSRTFVDNSAFKCEDTEKPGRADGLVAQAISPTQIQLTWNPATDNVGVASYAILRDRNGIASEGGTIYTDNNLRPDTEYCYAVVAVDKAGNRGPESEAVCARTPPRDAQPPGATGGLTATPISTSAIQLSWSGATGGAAAYVVSQDGRMVAQVAAPATTARIVRLQPGTRYCFQVAAVDAAGNVGAPSTQVCTTTLTAAAWTMKIKCEAQSAYVVEKDVDLDVAGDSTVSAVGDAIDYGGTPMAYQLFGTYSTGTSTLSGRINWTFAGTSAVRLDEFDVRFTGPDTGDVTMRQVQVTGCTAAIRFIRKGTPASAPMAAPGQSPGGPSLLQR